MRLASIDIGIDSAHTLVAEVSEELALRVIAAEKEAVSFADSVDKRGHIETLDLNEWRKALKNAKALCAGLEAETILAVASSAVREAANGVEFVRLAKQITGGPVRVLNPYTEARLSYLAVRESVHIENGSFLAIHIGGSDVRLIWGDRGEMLRWEALQLGALRLANRFPLSNPPKPKELDKLRARIRSELDKIFAEAEPPRWSETVAAGGTAMQLCRLAMNIRGEETSGALHQTRFSDAELQDVFSRLYFTKRKERKSSAHLDKANVDTVIPGAMVFEQLLERFQVQSLSACAFSLREGLLYDHMDRKRGEIAAAQAAPDLRLRSALLLARRCQWDEAHCRHVADIALAIFDALAPAMKWPKKERVLLECAAYLHDIGKIVNAASHHRHSQYIIENSDLIGFDPQEKRALGNIARYHRGAQPKKKHELYGALSKKERQRVDRLSSVLRIAEGLDRLHYGAVQEARCSINDKRFLIELVAENGAAFETTVGQERAAPLSKVLKRPVTIQAL